MSRPRGRMNRQTVMRLAGSILAFALLVFLLSRQGWGEILASIRQISLARFLLAFGLVMVSRLAVSARWHRLLHVSQARLPFWQILRITFAGLFATNFLPSTVGGDVVRLAGALQLRTDRALVAASIVVDRLVGMFAMAMALPLGAGSLWVWMAGRGGVESSLPRWSAAPPLLSAGWPRKAWAYSRRVTRRLVTSLALWLKHPRNLFAATGFSWVHMACKFIAIQVLFAGMGEAISFWQVAGLWSFTYFITLFPVSINGLGLQEVSMSFIFSNLGGVGLNSALTAALLVRTLELVASLPGALFLPTILAGVSHDD